MLSNRLALITGASSGIGNTVAKLFAKNGAAVALVDANKSIHEETEKFKTAYPSNLVSGHVCDVSDSAQVNNLFKEIQSSFSDFKAPSIVINSAGITRDSFLLKMTEKDFDQVIAVNLKGTFLVTQAALRAIISNLPENNEISVSNGSIINIASVVGKFGNIGQANYSASKAGVEGLTRTTAKEVGRYKIRCNAILPGFIATPMTDKVPAKVLDQMRRMIPMGRIGDPKDIAELALFLASDSSSYITGTSIECSGGLSFKASPNLTSIFYLFFYSNKIIILKTYS